MALTKEDLDRIAELEELLEMGEELDEEDREELKELRIERRVENRRNKALSAWNKAKEVYRLTFPSTDDEPCYALTTKAIDELAAMYDWDKGSYVVEKIARPDFAVGYDQFQQVYDRLDAE